MLFAALGGIAYAFFLWSGQNAWVYLAHLLWPTSMFTLFIYVAVVGLVHPALVVSALLFLAAGGLIYLVYYLRGRYERVNGVIVEWEAEDDSSSPTEAGGMAEVTRWDEPR